MGAASIGMDFVFEVGLKLPDVKESPYYGARALKLNGQMVACTPVNKSAEVNSVVVAMSFERRAALLKKSPSLYYITDHGPSASDNADPVVQDLPRGARADSAHGLGFCGLKGCRAAIARQGEAASRLTGRSVE